MRSSSAAAKKHSEVACVQTTTKKISHLIEGYSFPLTNDQNLKDARGTYTLLTNSFAHEKL
jgi:hypothetical protein